MVDCRRCFFLVTVPVYERNYSWQCYAGDAYRCAYFDKVIVKVTRECDRYTDIALAILTKYMDRVEEHAKRTKVRK